MSIYDEVIRTAYRAYRHYTERGACASGCGKNVVYILMDPATLSAVQMDTSYPVYNCCYQRGIIANATLHGFPVIVTDQVKGFLVLVRANGQ